MATETSYDLTSLEDVRDLRALSSGFVLLGLGIIVLGILGLIAGPLTAMASVVVVGALLVAAGLSQSVGAFAARRWGGFFLQLLTGILYLAAGVFAMRDPWVIGEVTGQVLAVLFGVALVCAGAVRASLTLFTRYLGPAAGGLLGGLFTILAGGLVLLKATVWPELGLLILAFCVSTDLIINGLGWLGVGLAMRQLQPRPKADESRTYLVD